MTTIFPGFGDTKYIVQNMSDCVCIDPTVVAITSANVGGVGIVTATWPAFDCVFEGISHHVAAGSSNINAADVASPTTYFTYFQDVAGVPTFTASTTNPDINPAVDEYFITNIIRFKSVGGTVTFYLVKYPSQNGIYELAHNLKGNVMYYDPLWVSGLAPTLSAGGKVSTTAGYTRFIGNEARTHAAVTDGALMLDDESATVAGIDNIATYSGAGGAITAGKYVKLLVGVVRGSTLLSGQYRVMRQAKPTVEYASRADALADADGKAATSFGIQYRAGVTPLFYIITVMGAGATSDYTQAGAYPAGDLIDLRETGLTGGGGGGGAGVTSHSSLSDLNVVGDHPGYVTLDGTRDLTGDWSVTHAITTTADVTADQLVSTIAIGTKPIDVTSTTVCTNLNADMVDGVHGPFVEADGTQALTAAWDAGSFKITALQLESDIATGVGAPLVVASTDKVTNLNADQIDGYEGAAFLQLAGGTMTGALNMGTKSITSANDVGATTVTATGLAKALTFESTQTTGTAPMVVASTTVVTSLNADQLDGNHATAFAVAAKGVTNGDTHDHVGGDGAQIAHSGLSGLTAPADDHTQYLLADGTRALSGNWDAGTKSITTTSSLSGSTLVSTLASGGAAPMTVTSTTKVTNLNADMLDGLHDTSFLKADGSVQLTGNLPVTGGVTIDGIDISAHAANINAHHTLASLDDNANTVLSLTDQAIGLDTQTANYVWAGPTTGAAAVPSFRALVVADMPVAPSAALTLANTGNDNVALSVGKSVFYATGPTANFAVTGFALAGGNVDGTIIRIHNGSAKTMTLTNDATSTAANRLYSGGATVPSGEGCTFVYNSSVARWIKV